MDNKYKNELLTKREVEVLSLVVEGLSNEVIADRLVISVHTVKAHLESIYRKFSVRNKVQAAVFAVLSGIIKVKDYSGYKF